ncbi:putative lipoprotein [Streptomyces humidus]|uniref:Lipoprotein n=1 Tax=Streptomyces humidus TaxID=52259 RepID=A0A918FY44_9ACTN|nr:putative lipoprotein [Streptomyces humidus]
MGVLGLSALLVTGCAAVGGAESGGGGDPAAAAAVTRAARKAEEPVSLRYRMTGRTPEEGRIKGEAAIGVKPPAMSLKSTVLSGPARGTGEFRLVGGALYVGSDQPGQGGKHWIRFGAPGRSGAARGLGAGTGTMADRVRDNPSHESGFLAAADDLKKAGVETVGGVSTAHYTGTATVDAIRASYKDDGATVRQRTEKSLAQYEKLGVDELTMDLWTDAQDRTRQLRMQGFGRHGRLDLTLTFTDFGKPVTVKAPPASDTVDLAEELGKAGR